MSDLADKLIKQFGHLVPKRLTPNQWYRVYDEAGTIKRENIDIVLRGAPDGNRTRVSDVKGRRPGPLDDGSSS